MDCMKIKIYGRVQGVGLRNRIKKFCAKSKINGYVKNCSDGSVLIVTSEKKADELIKWLKKNKGFSKIKEIKTEKSAEKNLSGFEVRKDSGYFADKFKSFSNLLFPKKKIENIPKHVVIIPDGNRRWAKARGMKGTEGHKKSAEKDNVVALFEETKKLGIKYISIWVFSTENWKRSEEEKKVLFDLLGNSMDILGNYFHEHKIRFRHIGRKDRLPKKLVEKLKSVERETKKYSDYNAQLLIDYGGRDEIVRAVNKIIKKEKKIDEEKFSEYLDTNGIPDPDLVIRTSGEKRISGLMPYQATYSEFYFVKKHFPAFKPRDLRKAVKNFSKRKRTFGGNLK